MSTFVHATSVAFRHRASWRGVLLRGPSGAGKSDLALRAIAAGGRLISDDQTRLSIKDRQLIATAPATLAGLIEARGIGIVRLPRGQVLTRARIFLAVDLVRPEKIERLPDPVCEDFQGLSLPVIALAPFEASTVAKLRLALVQFANA